MILILWACIDAQVQAVLGAHLPRSPCSAAPNIGFGRTQWASTLCPTCITASHNPLEWWKINYMNKTKNWTKRVCVRGAQNRLIFLRNFRKKCASGLGWRVGTIGHPTPSLRLRNKTPLPLDPPPPSNRRLEEGLKNRTPGGTFYGILIVDSLYCIKIHLRRVLTQILYFMIIKINKWFLKPFWKAYFNNFKLKNMEIYK